MKKEQLTTNMCTEFFAVEHIQNITMEVILDLSIILYIFHQQFVAHPADQFPFSLTNKAALS